MTTGSTISIDTSDGPMHLYVAEPPDTPRGAVVVVQEAFGVTPHIEHVCHVIAEHGWLTVAPALFHRVDTQVFHYDDLKSVMPIMMTLTKEGIDADLDAAIDYIVERGIEGVHTGIVGFCMGGSVTLYAAATRSLGAAVTFYGGGLGQGRFGFPSGLDLATRIQVPWLGLYGDLDQSIPVDDVEQLRVVAARSSVPTEVVRYAEAMHGFHCDDRPAVYHVEVAADARARMLDWFQQHLA